MGMETFHAGVLVRCVLVISLNSLTGRTGRGLTSLPDDEFLVPETHLSQGQLLPAAHGASGRRTINTMKIPAQVSLSPVRNVCHFLDFSGIN